MMDRKIFPTGVTIVLGGNTALPCAVVAEWLRRLTRNQIPSGSVGSNPTDCVKLFYLQPRSFLFRILLLGRKYNVSIVGSVVECSPATRAARVRFPDDATFCFRISYDCDASLQSEIIEEIIKKANMQ